MADAWLFLLLSLAELALALAGVAAALGGLHRLPLWLYLAAGVTGMVSDFIPGAWKGLLVGNTALVVISARFLWRHRRRRKRAPRAYG